MLDNGRYGSISAMAAAEKIDRGYLGRTLQLALLAPDLVEAVLDGMQPADLALPALLKLFPADWKRQRGHACAAFQTDDPATARPPPAAPIGSAPMRLGPPPTPELPAEDRTWARRRVSRG
jgi:hypothetical protein